MLIAVLNIIKTIKYSEFDQLIPGETISKTARFVAPITDKPVTIP